jgi:murein DD-endopeptidase MepM/ murein hydrolase activator NlpD
VFPRHPGRLGALVLALVGLLPVATVTASAQEDTPADSAPADAAPEAPTPALTTPDNGSGDGSGDEPIPPGDTPPGPDGEPGGQPPASPCPPHQVPSGDGGCIDPAVLAQILADYEAAAREERLALDELAVALERLDDLRTRLSELEEQVAAAKRRLVVAAEDAAYAALRRQVSEENLADVEAALADEEQRLRAQAVESYINGGEAEVASQAAILDAESLTDPGTHQVYAQAMVDDQLATLDRIDALEHAVAALGERVEELTAEAAVTVDELAVLEREVAELLGRQRMLVAEAELQTEDLAATIAEIQARKAQYAEELAVTAGGGGAIGDLLNAAQAGQSPPESVADLLRPPLDPVIVASPFGQRFHPILHIWRMHAGADLDGPAGAPITAAADGTVLVASTQGGYGNAVVIDHGNGFGTVYAHMSAIAVPVGTQVTAGQVIGFVGSTGLSTGPHLHFELRVHGQPIDPMPYLDLTPDEAPAR